MPVGENQVAASNLEAEYDNRGRVPEYENIFATWTRDAELYRAETLKAGRAALGLSYGDTPRQALDIFLPQPDRTGPLAMFIHGGYWRSLDPSMFSHMARGLNGRGIAVAIPGYDLCPNVTIADIIAQIRRACIFLWARFSQRLLVYGHSAGGHLTAAMVATDWQSLYPKAPSDLVPAGYAISGLYDLMPLVDLASNQDLRLNAETAVRLSPLHWPLPADRSLDAVVGGVESAEFKRQSRIIADAWARAAQTRYDEIADANHFTILDTLPNPESAMVARIATLAHSIKS